MRFMMRLLAAALVLPAAVAPVVAQTTCTPEKLNAAIDAFAFEPFGARSWRMLNGLGDPGLAAEADSYGGWAKSEDWKKLVAGVAPDMPSLQNVAYNCRMGYPVETLNARIGKLGLADPYITQWLKVQDKVLRACDGATADQTTLPPPLEVKPELAQLQQDDRAYQTASVAFYLDKPKAVQLFKEIGQSNSPHKSVARYNVANLLANANNVVEARAEARAILADPTLASVHVITNELLGYIANIEDTASGWSELIDSTVATLTEPLATVSASDASRKAFSSALYDISYAGIRDKRDDWWVAGRLPENPTLSKAIVDASRKHPMALWMMTGQSVAAAHNSVPWTLNGTVMQAWTSSYIDRALALEPAGKGITGLSRDLVDALKSNSDDAARATLWGKARAAMAKAEASCGEAPETAAAAELTYQATRLSAIVGKFGEAADVLAGLPIMGSAAYQQIIIPALLENVLATGNAAEGRVLRDRLLTPEFFAAIGGNNREYELATYSHFLVWLAEDEAKFIEALKLDNNRLATPLLNLLPAKALRKLSGNEVFSAEQKALLVRAAWTRDYALGRRTGAKDLEQMLALNPEIKSTLDAIKTEFPKLAPDRQWLLTVLRNPRFGILVSSPDWSEALESKRQNFAELDQFDHNDKNWWCPLETDRHLAAVRKTYDEQSGLLNPQGYRQQDMKALLDEGAVQKLEASRDALLKAHPMVKLIDWKEVTQLAKAPSAPEKLGRSAIRWGKASKGADGAPEALALAVRVSRSGCSWHGGHKAYSRPAQELLVQKFANTTWAKATPYWFDCMNNVWDKDFNKVASCNVKPWPKQSPLR